MITLEHLRSEKKAAILELAEMHGARSVRIFGSVARGDNRGDSDVDPTAAGRCSPVAGEQTS